MSVRWRVPRRDCSIAQRFLGVGDDALDVDVDDVAEPFACLAGAERVVVVEELRLDVGVLDAAALAPQAAAEATLEPSATVELYGVGTLLRLAILLSSDVIQS